ncbi:MAG: hypothetical protein U0N58_00700, partial [Senegalimassilia anaerobia]
IFLERATEKGAHFGYATPNARLLCTKRAYAHLIGQRKGKRIMVGQLVYGYAIVARHPVRKRNSNPNRSPHVSKRRDEKPHSGTSSNRIALGGIARSRRRASVAA